MYILYNPEGRPAPQLLGYIMFVRAYVCVRLCVCTLQGMDLCECGRICEFARGTWVLYGLENGSAAGSRGDWRRSNGSGYV